jgi:hypothetical protein
VRFWAAYETGNLIVLAGSAIAPDKPGISVVDYQPDNTSAVPIGHLAEAVTASATSPSIVCADTERHHCGHGRSAAFAHRKSSVCLPAVSRTGAERRARGCGS